MCSAQPLGSPEKTLASPLWRALAPLTPALDFFFSVEALIRSVLRMLLLEEESNHATTFFPFSRFFRHQ